MDIVAGQAIPQQKGLHSKGTPRLRCLRCEEHCGFDKSQGHSLRGAAQHLANYFKYTQGVHTAQSQQMRQQLGPGAHASSAAIPGQPAGAAQLLGVPQGLPYLLFCPQCYMSLHADPGLGIYYSLMHSPLLVTLWHVLHQARVAAALHCVAAPCMLLQDLDTGCCVCRAAVTLEAFKPGESKLLQCLQECGADAALMFDPSVGRTARVLETASVFAGLADAVLCVIRLCLRKVGMACHLVCMHCQHQCCWQLCWQCAACCCCNITRA